VLGSGERWVEQKLRQLSAEHECFSVRFGFSEALAHRIEAGADLFLMPSRYEPCGLNQLYSQRYGTLPVVRAVGGLDDTVKDGENGFKFADLSSAGLVATVLRAVGVYRDEPEQFRAMQQAAMVKSMGWDEAASQYQALYQLAIRQQ
jgi:starch synthase